MKTRSEIEAEKLGTTLEKIYSFIHNNETAKNNCNALLLSGVDFDEACVITYMEFI
jgi:hypothetical protein